MSLEEELEDVACSRQHGQITQEVFSCLSCREAYGHVVVLCAVCAETCHLKQQHEVISVGLKRNIGCDCGCGDGAPPCECAADPDEVRDWLNHEESLAAAHNFQGMFCWCDEPWTDVDAKMAQCAICSDWFHTKCIEAESGKPVDEEAFQEGIFICSSCGSLKRLGARVDALEYGTAQPPTPVCFSGCAAAPGQTVFLCRDFMDRLCRKDCCKAIVSSLNVLWEADDDDEDSQHELGNMIRQGFLEGIQHLSHDERIRAAEQFEQVAHHFQEALKNRKRSRDDDDDDADV